MSFSEIVLAEAEQQYIQLAEDSLQCPIEFPAVPSLAKYQTKSDKFRERIKRENKELSKAFNTINQNKKNRLEAENAKAEAEKAERLRREIARQDEIYQQQRAQQEQAERKKKLILHIVFFPFYLVYYIFYRLFLAVKALFTTQDGQTVFQFVSFASPLVLSVVFAIVLFSNKEQIGIVSNFGGWCTGWVFFTIASLIVSITLLKKRWIDWDYDDSSSIVGSIIVAIAMVVSSVIVFSNAGKLTSNFDPTTFISFSVTGKTDSSSYWTYDSTISFSIQNNSNVQVTYINGEMKLYNGSTEVAIYNVSFNGEYNGGQSYKTTVKFEKSDADLYNTSFANLGITYKITSMKFNGDYQEHKYNGQTMTLKAIGDTSGSENNYKETVSLYDQGKYTEAQMLFESLGDYKDSSWYANQCENKAFYQEMESYLHSIAGSNAILPDNYTLYLSYNRNDYFYYNY